MVRIHEIRISGQKIDNKTPYNYKKCCTENF